MANFFLGILKSTFAAVALNCPYAKLLPSDLTKQADLLAIGFTAAHLQSGAFRFGQPAFYKAGELYAAAEGKGQGLNGQALILANAYHATNRMLAQKSVPFTGSLPDQVEAALVAKILGVSFRQNEKQGWEIPAQASPSRATARLKYLTVSSMGMPEGARSGYLQRETVDLQKRVAEDLGMADLVNRSYRAGELSPVDFDAKGNLRDPSRFIAPREGWIFAGVAMPGYSRNPQFRAGARLFYWKTKGALGNTRVAENWREVSGKWILHSVEMEALRSEPDDWVPVNVKPADGDSSKLEWAMTRNCNSCHAARDALASSHGPRPKNVGPVAFEQSPFSKAFSDARRIHAHQQDGARN